MKEQIHRRAMELGFDDCRFARANAPDTARQFQNWVAAKRHGQMVWLEKSADKRIEPQKVLAKAKTVIALAASYEMGDRQDACPTVMRLETGKMPVPQDACPTGVVARYARFDDYHEVLGARLKSLAQFVNETGGAPTRSVWYVDTGPILERDFAQRAGIGFVGKHTNLISRRFGNWIFLAEILTTLKIEPDAPEKNHCGKCARCLAACPTGAIPAPFELDARRCISYLTIELKGSIPEEFRRTIGNRIYGCDDCLAVCPWNRFACEGSLMKSHARNDLVSLDQPALIELLSLDEKGFKARFAGSPILRTKRRGFLRNVCVALGNVGDKSALPALEKASGDPEPLIAEHARWAMEEIERRARQGAQPAS